MFCSQIIKCLSVLNFYVNALLATKSFSVILSSMHDYLIIISSYEHFGCIHSIEVYVIRSRW